MAQERSLITLITALVGTGDRRATNYREQP
jgi:hypothetical protein